MGAAAFFDPGRRLKPHNDASQIAGLRPTRPGGPAGPRLLRDRSCARLRSERHALTPNRGPYEQRKRPREKRDGVGAPNW